MTQLLKISIFIWNIFQYRHVGHIQRSLLKWNTLRVLYARSSPFTYQSIRKLYWKILHFDSQIASERHPRPKRLATVREHWRCDRDARTIGDTRDRDGTTPSLGGPELLQRAGIRQRIPTSAYSQEQGNQPSNVCKIYCFTFFWKDLIDSQKFFEITHTVVAK